MDRITRHINAYREEGRLLQHEERRIVRLKRRIENNPAILLTFGTIIGDGSHVQVADTYEDGKIVLAQPVGDNLHASVMSKAARGCDRASEIAYPGLRACLLMWLAEAERANRTAIDAWAARDPIAEAVALPAVTS
jgi:hypothetical protein